MKLSKITFEGDVTKIDSQAFAFCASLESITLSDKLESIGKSAFLMCSKLKTINYKGTEEQWMGVSFNADWDATGGKFEVVYNFTE